MSSRKTTSQFRSLSPSGRFCSSSFSTHPTRSLTRPNSPTHVTVSPSSSFRLTPLASNTKNHHTITHRFSQNNNNINNNNSTNKNNNNNNNSNSNRNIPKKKTCACSPTTHPGSYRCSLHKGNKVNNEGKSDATSYRSSQQLNMRRSAMTNSLVRIGTVEGELAKRTLASLIRPSSHSLRRRVDFQPRKSRLSVMVKAEDV